jgi:hypothetical protein
MVKAGFKVVTESVSAYFVLLHLNISRKTKDIEILFENLDSQLNLPL